MAKLSLCWSIRQKSPCRSLSGTRWTVNSTHIEQQDSHHSMLKRDRILSLTWFIQENWWRQTEFYLWHHSYGRLDWRQTEFYLWHHSYRRLDWRQTEFYLWHHSYRRIDWRQTGFYETELHWLCIHQYTDNVILSGIEYYDFWKKQSHIADKNNLSFHTPPFRHSLMTCWNLIILEFHKSLETENRHVQPWTASSVLRSGDKINQHSQTTSLLLH